MYIIHNNESDLSINKLQSDCEPTEVFQLSCDFLVLQVRGTLLEGGGGGGGEGGGGGRGGGGGGGGGEEWEKEK